MSFPAQPPGGIKVLLLLFFPRKEGRSFDSFLLRKE
jgi:hypothetical protein